MESLLWDKIAEKWRLMKQNVYKERRWTWSCFAVERKSDSGWRVKRKLKHFKCCDWLRKCQCQFCVSSDPNVQLCEWPIVTKRWEVNFAIEHMLKCFNRLFLWTHEVIFVPVETLLGRLYLRQYNWKLFVSSGAPWIIYHFSVCLVCKLMWDIPRLSTALMNATNIQLSGLKNFWHRELHLWVD